MKISIITICLNSEQTINLTFNSVLIQNYKNIEHIIVDGESDDSTNTLIADYGFPNKKVFVKKGLGLYGSLNFGIKKATGQYILILHSDDVLNNENVISDLVKILKKKNCSCLFGSVIFFKKIISNTVRFYPSINFKLSHLKKGLIPPHTGSIIKKNIYRKYLFNTSYKIAGDYDFFVRSLYLGKVDFAFTNKVVTRMKTGGTSGKNINSYIVSSFEIFRSLTDNLINVSFFKIFFRFIFKLKEITFLNVSKLNTNFSLKIHKFYKIRIKYDFIIYRDFNKIFKNNNFILAAMNLAFLGHYVNNDIFKFPYLFFWPDGIFSKILNKKLLKIPGREILEKIKLPKKIKKIIVLGNLHPIAFNKLTNKFKKKIIHYKLPFADSKTIFEKLKYRPGREDIIFITLPTPKQEKLALAIARKFQFYKIICIGGSIAIWSGLERKVPDNYINFEFLWRLRYETRRRFIRLFKTCYYVVKDFITYRKIIKLKIFYKK
jgi:glycosyltransferase involved in cell wall biosynthesis